jgi:spoIIIJ-associated protein
VAHAEASARTVEAAVTAAAAKLGLRSDQVDVEVLEDPVPSTFGYIGTPARVRVTPRQVNVGRPQPSPDPGVAPAPGGPAGPLSRAAPTGGLDGVEAPPPVAPPSWERSDSVNTSVDPSAGSGTDPADAVQGRATEEPQGAPPAAVAASTPEVATTAGQPSAADSDGGNGRVPTGVVGETEDQAERDTVIGTAGAGTAGAGTPGGTPAAGTGTGSAAPPAAGHAIPADGVQAGEGAFGIDTSTAPADIGSSRATGTPRPTYRDEPLEPQMVEEDTERAGDFLEGLLDALDVDGDITTWVDQAGGHIDLEGQDLDVLIGPNGETLDALQELTRLAVLRQSKRRVRLLIDINGFRARQREQLVSMVRATAEQVIKTRQDHEFQPMTPAERKVVHDAVAAIEGARTESLGEEPNRRVVIRPA